MASQEVAESLFRYIDDHVETYKDRLREAVAIPSVSAELDDHLADIIQMMEWTRGHVERLGGLVTLKENPLTSAGRPLPPILMGDFSTGDPKKLTVCAYGHLDVQPAKKGDGWNTEPFVLTEKEGKLFGRGSTDDKGPALSWLWVVEAHQALGMELPVNLKVLFEGMEESGSEGLHETIMEEVKSGNFLSDVDFFTICDNYWLGKSKPCLTYGLRGISYFQVEIQCSEQDLHSGVLGGTVYEGMTDLVHLMASLVDSKANILVEGVMDDVDPVTPEEEALYETIEFSLEDYKEETKVKNVSSALLHDNKKDLLMSRWRYPTLSLHGIEGAFSGPGPKTVIPGRVIGKFSLRLVPKQDPKHIEQVVCAHLEKKFKELGSPNKMNISMIHGAKAWLSDPKHPNYDAAARAVKKVYGQLPDYTREGGSIPITSTFEDATGMNVLLLPIGACDDMAHSQNEKYNCSNLVNAIKVIGIYLHELTEIKGPKPSNCRCLPLTATELMIPGAFIKGFRCSCEI